MPSYTDTCGRTLTYDKPSPELAAFIERVRAASLDSSVTANDMISLVYGPDNPLLDPTLLPGRYMVTPAVFANPVYHILTDLVYLKDVRLGRVDMAKAHAPFTIGVPEAAEQLGVTRQTIHNAIETYRLSAIFKNGHWYTSPQAVAAFKVSKAGRPRKESSLASPATAVRVKMGGKPGVSLSVRVEGGEIAGDLFPSGWTRAVVKTKFKAVTRAFVLEPAPGANESIKHGEGDLFVEGAFKITEKINNTSEANKVWKGTTRLAVS